MRPNQQNKRSRSRNNNRKSSNPLTRSYESNGPDVRVRGNAAHIAEKYMQLARDANSSGDSVAAENYLQHAEHYFRIISAAQDQAHAQQSVRAEQTGRTEPGDNRGQGDNRGPGESATGDGGSGQSATPPASEDGDGTKESAVRGENTGFAEKKEPRAPRARRPRRPRVSEKSAAAAPAPADAVINGAPEDVPNQPVPATNEMDPADAPQPELGELPSFVTEQSKTPAS